MRNAKGQFKKGHHWRNPKLYWDKAWLTQEYVELEKSASEIAKEQGCKENNIHYFLKKHNIPTRTIAEARAIKYWALTGEANGMAGRTGSANPRWRGGVTPERQAIYASREWATAVKAVWKRDRATCQRCGARKDKSNRFHIHHIGSFADFPALRTDVDNLVLLCHPCHSWVHSKANKGGEFCRSK